MSDLNQINTALERLFGPQQKLALATEFVNGIPWQAREKLLDAGEIQVCWLCGLPYVWKADVGNPEIELLAAPVMLASGVRRSCDTELSSELRSRSVSMWTCTSRASSASRARASASAIWFTKVSSW